MAKQSEPGGIVALIARFLLFVVVVASAYIVLKPGYNIAQWTPNSWMRSIGFSYESVLAYEHYFHWFMHFAVGFMATGLLYFSRIYFLHNNDLRFAASCVLMTSFAVMLEFWQSALGESVEIADIVFGVAGIMLATMLYLVFRGRKKAA